MDLVELLTRFERYAGPYDHDLTRAECGCCTFLDRETEARWLGFWGAWEIATNTEREACAKICHEAFMELECGSDRSDPQDDREAHLQSTVVKQVRDEIMKRSNA